LAGAASEGLGLGNPAHWARRRATGVGYSPYVRPHNAQALTTL
jgi:hypothetical protein